MKRMKIMKVQALVILQPATCNLEPAIGWQAFCIRAIRAQEAGVVSATLRLCAKTLLAG